MFQWMENSFYDHLDKFANSLGYDNADLAITLAMVPWATTQERDAFIETLTDKNAAGGTGQVFSANVRKGGSK